MLPTQYVSVEGAAANPTGIESRGLRLGDNVVVRVSALDTTWPARCGLETQSVASAILQGWSEPLSSLRRRSDLTLGETVYHVVLCSTRIFSETLSATDEPPTSISVYQQIAAELDEASAEAVDEGLPAVKPKHRKLCLEIAQRMHWHGVASPSAGMIATVGTDGRASLLCYCDPAGKRLSFEIGGELGGIRVYKTQRSEGGVQTSIATTTLELAALPALAEWLLA